MGTVNEVILGQAVEQKTNCISMGKDWLGAEGVWGTLPDREKLRINRGKAAGQIKASEMQRTGPR